MRYIVAFIVVTTLSVSLFLSDACASESVKSVCKVSIEQAIEAALGSMEDIKISIVETEKAYHGYRETQALRYPDLTGHGYWTNNARYPVNQRYPEGSISDYEAGMGATLHQVIWSFGRNRLGSRQGTACHPRARGQAVGSAPRRSCRNPWRGHPRYQEAGQTCCDLVHNGRWL